MNEFNREIPCHPEIPGLYTMPNIISEEKEASILESLKNSNGWRTMGKNGRRVLQFGHIYNFREARVDLAEEPRLPQYLQQVMDRVSQLQDQTTGCSLMQDPATNQLTIFDQIIVNAYDKSQGISPHIDRTHCFGAVIVGLSLGDDAILTFQRRSSTGDHLMIHEVAIPRRSIYIMTGDSRYLWRHGIDCLRNAKIRGNHRERISVTWRQVING